MSQSNPFAAPDGSTGSAGSPSGERPEYATASSWTRLLAYVIDSFLAVTLLLGGFVVFFAFVFLVAPEAGDAMLADENPLLDVVGRVAGFLVPTLYGAAFEASPWMATPGKRMLGLRVVTATDDPLDISQALQRNFVKSFALSCCGLLAFTAVDGRPGVWNDSAGFRVVKRV